jgi:hypothetical protein
MIDSPVTTVMSSGYVTVGDVLVFQDGSKLEVSSWEPYGDEVALFSSSGERWLFGRYELITVVGYGRGREFVSVPV